MRQTQRRAGRLFTVLVALLQAITPIAADHGEVVEGQATITHTDAHTVDVHQASDSAIIHWRNFDIAVDELVRFQQPGPESVALNQVTGSDPTNIFGQLVANGRVFIVNPNGITFGPEARVDVAGLLASTFNVSDPDLPGGRFRFDQDPTRGLAAVVNQGEIRVSPSGFVFLVAPAVSNEGLIVANLGKVVLGSGESLYVDFMGDGLVHFEIGGKVLDSVTTPDGRRLDSAVSNTGRIQADGGQVVLQAHAGRAIFSSVVNNGGIIEARSLLNHGGVVRLEGGDPVEGPIRVGAVNNLGRVQGAEGAVLDTGTIDVSAMEADAVPGQVFITGELVGVSGNVFASGGARGGEVLISSSRRTVVTDAGAIDVSGSGASDAGTAVVWSDEDTRFYGTIFGRGGALGGDGAQAEVSGFGSLGYEGTADLSAASGEDGSLLLDPLRITMVLGALGTLNGSLPSILEATLPDPGTVGATSIQNALANGDVTLEASISVVATPGVDISWATPSRLTIRTTNRFGDGLIDLTSCLLAATGQGSIVLSGNTVGGFNGRITTDFMSSVAGLISVQIPGGAIRTLGSISSPGGAVVLSGAEVLLQGNIEGDSVTVSGVVSVNPGVAITTTGAGGITLQGDLLGFAPTLNAGTGPISLDQVGAFERIQGLDLRTTGPIRIARGILSLNALTFPSRVVLTGILPIMISAELNGVRFRDRIDGAAELAVDGGNGAVTFDGSIGSETPLGRLSVDASTIEVNAGIITQGAVALVSTVGAININRNEPGPVTVRAGTDLTLRSATDLTVGANGGPVTQVLGATSITVVVPGVRFVGDNDVLRQGVPAGINLTAPSFDIAVLEVPPGEDITLTATAGDIILGRLVAPGGVVTLRATGRVLNLNNPGPVPPDTTNVTAAFLSITAGGLAGEQNPAIQLNTAIDRLTLASATGSGSISIQNQGALTIDTVSATSGAVRVTSNQGGLRVTREVSTLAGLVSLNARGGGGLTLDPGAAVRASTDIAYIADQLFLAGSASNAGRVIVQSDAPGRDMRLGSVSDASALGLRTTDLTTITAGTLRLGNFNARPPISTVTIPIDGRGPTGTFGELIVMSDEIRLNSASGVTTTGTQSYDGVVVLGASQTLRSTAGGVGFGQTVNGPVNLIVDAPNGLVQFLGEVGGAAPLSSLIATSGTLTVGSSISTRGAISLTTTGPGGTIRLGRLIAPGAAVTLRAVAGLVLNQNGPQNPIDPTSVPANVTAASLSVTAGGSTADFQPAIELYTAIDRLTLANASGGGSILIQNERGLTVDSVTAAAGSVTLIANRSEPAATGDLRVTRDVSSLTGRVTLVARLGGVLTIDPGATVTALTNIDYVADQMFLAGSTSNARLVGVRADSQDRSMRIGGVSDPSVLGLRVADLMTITAVGLIVGDTPRPLRDLTLAIALDGRGPTGSFRDLTLTAPGIFLESADGVTTVGDQTYDGPVVLRSSQALQSTTGDMEFLGTVNGPFDLTVTAPGDRVTFAQGVGGTAPLTSLNVTAGRLSVNSGIMTSGALGLATTLGNLEVNVTEPFAAIVQSGTSLSLNSAGDIRIGRDDGPVTQVIPGTTFFESLAGTRIIGGNDVYPPPPEGDINLVAPSFNLGELIAPQGRNITLTATAGNIVLGRLVAPGGRVTLRATLGKVLNTNNVGPFPLLPPNVTADSLTVVAGGVTGPGEAAIQLNTEINTLTLADAPAGGFVSITDASGMEVFTANAASGAVTLTSLTGGLRVRGSVTSGDDAVRLRAQAGGALTIDPGVQVRGAGVEYTADRMFIAGSMTDAGASFLAVRNDSPGRTIVLGRRSDEDALGLLREELASLRTTGELTIGRTVIAASGDIGVAIALDGSGPSGTFNRLRLETGGRIFLNSPQGVRTPGDQTYRGAVVLSESQSLVSTNGGAISVGGPVDGQFVLSLDSGAGPITLDGGVGASDPLALLVLSTSAPLGLGSNVVTVGPLVFPTQVNLAARPVAVRTFSSPVVFNGAVSGASDFTVLSGAGAVTFNGDVAVGTLTVNAGTLDVSRFVAAQRIALTTAVGVLAVNGPAGLDTIVHSFGTLTMSAATDLRIGANGGPVTTVVGDGGVTMSANGQVTVGTNDRVVGGGLLPGAPPADVSIVGGSVVLGEVTGADVTINALRGDIVLGRIASSSTRDLFGAYEDPLFSVTLSANGSVLNDNDLDEVNVSARELSLFAGGIGSTGLALVGNNRDRLGTLNTRVTVLNVTAGLVAGVGGVGEIRIDDRADPRVTPERDALIVQRARNITRDPVSRVSGGLYIRTAKYMEVRAPSRLAPGFGVFVNDTTEAFLESDRSISVFATLPDDQGFIAGSNVNLATIVGGQIVLNAGGGVYAWNPDTDLPVDPDTREFVVQTTGSHLQGRFAILMGAGAVGGLHPAQTFQTTLEVIAGAVRGPTRELPGNVQPGFYVKDSNAIRVGSIDTLFFSIRNRRLTRVAGVTATQSFFGLPSVVIRSDPGITVDAPIEAAGSIVLDAVENPLGGAEDFIVVNSTVRSETDSVELRAGDDIFVNAGGALEAATTVTLSAGVGDNDGVGSLSLDGAATARSVVLSAPIGVITQGGRIVGGGLLADIDLATSDLRMRQTTERSLLTRMLISLLGDDDLAMEDVTGVPGHGLAIEMDAPPDGESGTAYRHPLAASGATGLCVWSIVAGRLPEGLSLDPRTGVIEGTPTDGGTSEFTVEVIDADGRVGRRTLSIAIRAR